MGNANSSSSTATTSVQDLDFITLLVGIILGWILVSLWTRVIDNLSFNTLKLDKHSTYHTCVIALVATSIFLAFIFNFNALVSGVLESDTSGGGLVPPS